MAALNRVIALVAGLLLLGAGAVASCEATRSSTARGIASSAPPPSAAPMAPGSGSGRVSAAVPWDGAQPANLLAAAETLADRPTKSLAELWRKRLAAAYIGKVERELVEEAMSKLSSAMQLTSIDE